MLSNENSLTSLNKESYLRNTFISMTYVGKAYIIAFVS